MSEYWDKVKETRVKHPSYGTVQFSRISQSRCNLFGSPLKYHASTIRLYIREADRTHRLSEDRIFGGNDIIMVELSPAQFAELLTTMNVGTGVPCTIRHRQGVGKIEDPPDDLLEVERVQHGFKNEFKELKSWVSKHIKKAEKLLRKQKLSKQDKEDILWTMKKMLQNIESNWPFVLEQFTAATERVVTTAKAEVDAFVTHMVQKTGLKQLREMAQSVNLIEAGDKK